MYMNCVLTTCLPAGWKTAPNLMADGSHSMVAGNSTQNLWKGWAIFPTTVEYILNSLILVPFKTRHLNTSWEHSTWKLKAIPAMKTVACLVKCIPKNTGALAQGKLRLRTVPNGVLSSNQSHQCLFLQVVAWQAFILPNTMKGKSESTLVFFCCSNLNKDCPTGPNKKQQVTKEEEVLEFGGTAAYSQKKPPSAGQVCQLDPSWKREPQLRSGIPRISLCVSPWGHFPDWW